MVATIAAGTTAAYYSKQTEYYLGGREPPGRWISRTGDFGVVDGAEVRRDQFERLHAGLDEGGWCLPSNTGDVKERVAGLDLTLSAPKSVSILYALAGPEVRKQIEVAQQRAAEATVGILDRHAAYGRRGRQGLRLERVSLTAATFQHGEARPVEHDDGKVFADPNLHTHCVILNLAKRADSTVGALDGRFLFAWKMAAGAAYHAALAAELQALGFDIGEVGKNGIFEVAGVSGEIRAYFSARRREVEEAMAGKGLTTGQAPALAAAIALSSRKSKIEVTSIGRFERWATEAKRFGIVRQRFVEDLRMTRRPNRIARDKAVAERLAALPQQLTEHESVFEKRQLFAAVGTALVGTGAGADLIEIEVERLIRKGLVIELARDDLNQPSYSTPQMIALERDLVRLAHQLSRRHPLRSNVELSRNLCRDRKLNAQQTEAVLAATAPLALAIMEGAAGSGKTTTLGPIVEAYQQAGARVVGTAQAWRIAHQLRDDLGIESKATDAWIASSRAGGKFLDRKTVLLIDEAGLLSSPQMHAVLSEVARTGAKAILIGDRQQLKAIGAGAGLEILASVVESTRVDAIVRQREAWTRKAIMDFAKGRIADGLQAFVDREMLTACDSHKTAVQSLVDAWHRARQQTPESSALLIAKTNVLVRAINDGVRAHLKADGRIKGTDIEIASITPSGHPQAVYLAKGDSIRFLRRYDELDVINGTVATIEQISNTSNPRIKARIGKRQISFYISQVADDKGRAQITYAYASTIYGSQGLTTDRAFVLLDPSMNRHDLYVAASRGRVGTELFLDTRTIDAQICAELPLSQRRTAIIKPEARFKWLGQRLSRVHIKTCTLDTALTFLERSRSLTRQQSLEIDRG